MMSFYLSEFNFKIKIYMENLLLKVNDEIISKIRVHNF